jgi:hypothetical protein
MKTKRVYNQQTTRLKNSNIFGIMKPFYPKTMEVYRNGLLQEPGENADYIIIGNCIVIMGQLLDFEEKIIIHHDIKKSK